MVISKFYRQTDLHIFFFLTALSTVNFTSILEWHLARSICTWEMVELAFTLAYWVISTNKSGAFQITNWAFIMSEVFESEKEIVKLWTDHCVFGALLYFWSPHSTVNMDELIDLKGDQSACHSLLTWLLTQNTGQLGLRVIDSHIWFLTDL